MISHVKHDICQINSENMLKAIGQFMVMATSSNSRFDKYRRNESGGTLSTDELDGYAIFNQKCTSCHATDIFTDTRFATMVCQSIQQSMISVVFALPN